MYGPGDMAAGAGSAAWRGSHPPPRTLIAWRAHALAVADGYAVLKVHGGTPPHPYGQGTPGRGSLKKKNLGHSHVGRRYGRTQFQVPQSTGIQPLFASPLSARSGLDNRQLSGVDGDFGRAVRGSFRRSCCKRRRRYLRWSWGIETRRLCQLEGTCRTVCQKGQPRCKQRDRLNCGDAILSQRDGYSF